MKGIRTTGALAAAILTGAALHTAAGPAERASSGIHWEVNTGRFPTAAISWEKSFSAARTRAARVRKPILLLHLFGRLNEDMC